MLRDQENKYMEDGPPAIPLGETVVVETRFGAFEFTADSAIQFPNGLVGFANHRFFGLANLPAPAPEDFKLLQSLNEDAISFIVIPLDAHASPLDGADLDEACEASGVSRDTATLLFIVTIRPKADGEGVEMSVNLRAPIVFDLRARRARQHVLANDRYPLRQPVEELAPRVNVA